MRNVEICWSDSILEFRRSGLEGLRPFIIRRRNGSKSGEMVKCEMILAIGSRCDLLDPGGEYGSERIVVELVWRKIRAPQRLHFRVSQIGKSKGKRFKLAIREIMIRSGPSIHQECGPLI
jgi:hypothetical protein